MKRGHGHAHAEQRASLCEPTLETQRAVDCFRRDVAATAIETMKTTLPDNITRLTALIKTKTALRTAALQPLDRPTTVTLAELMATNPHLRTIRTEMGELQTAIHESTQLATDIKLWIQLNIPRIEDGNNFGVGIQESIVQELSRAEDAGLAAAEGLGRWWVARSKLVGKVVKYAAREQCPHDTSPHPHAHAHPHGHGQNCPSCQLYTNDPAVYALLDGDQRFLATLWMSWVDLRNNYAILHDLLSKNLEKLINPRSEHASSMY